MTEPGFGVYFPPMRTFPGGVHPEEAKWTRDRPIEAAPIPKRVVIPFLQHTGVPSRPVVKRGDRVRAGEVIGEPAGRVSVPTHATISGVVVELKEYPHPTANQRVLSCVIESDNRDEWVELSERPNWLELEPAQVVALTLQAGVVGLGGAAFPTHIKLAPPKERPIDTLILNGCECEPYLTCDHRLMIERPEEVLAGARLMARAVGCARVVVGVEANKPDAAARLERALPSEDGFSVVRLKTKYPQGAEKQLIKAVLGREVRPGGLPMDVGALVQNVGTAVAVYEAVRYSKPLVERVLTVTGPGVRMPKNLRVRIGTPIIDLVAACGGYTKPPRKLILGGPMMGVAQYSDELPVIKGTSGILVLTQEEVDQVREGPCLRCARCVDACPMRLLPCEIAKLVEHRNLKGAEEYNILDCIECGSCAYICPARIRLVHTIRLGKAELLARR